MTKQEYELTKLTEELSEVIKEVCKAQRFGLHDTNPTTGVTNSEAIQQELLDVVFIANKLGYRTNISKEERTPRKQKYQKWFKYSREEGIIGENK